MSDDPKSPEQGELIEKEWSLHLKVLPSEDGRFARTSIEIRRPTTRLPQYVNSADSTDMLYEKIQGEFNNALRLIINDIVETVVKPAKKLRR